MPIAMTLASCAAWIVPMTFSLPVAVTTSAPRSISERVISLALAMSENEPT